MYACINKLPPAARNVESGWHKEGRESWLEPSPWIGTGNVLGADGLRYGSLSWVDYFQFRKLGSKRQDGQSFLGGVLRFGLNWLLKIDNK
jgi:hypothetical protein